MIAAMDQLAPTEYVAPPSSQQPSSSGRFTGLSFAELRAAELLAEGLHSVRAVSRMSGMPAADIRRALSASPAFQDEVERIRSEFSRLVFSTGVALREVRVLRLCERAEALDRVVAQRAQMADTESEFYRDGAGQVPGASTGLLVPTVKAVGSGPAQTVVEEWELDRGLLAELRAVEEQAGKELGHYATRHVIESTTKAYIGVRIEDV